DDDGDVARPLEDARRPAVGAGQEPLRRRSLVDEGPLHVEGVHVDVVSRRRVGHGGAKRLQHEPRSALRRELEDAERGLDRLAADQVDHEARLLSGEPDEAGRRAALHHAPAFRGTPPPGAAAPAAGAAVATPSILPLRSPECPWKVRVGANSPSLWPTAFSVMNTGMNFRPLCTANVNPTMSGVIVERRDHVFTTRFSPDSTIARTFFMRCPSTNGPFFTDRAIASGPSSAARSSGPCACCGASCSPSSACPTASAGGSLS